MRSAIELGCSTGVRSKSVLGKACAGTRAPARIVRVEALSGRLLRHAPRPASADQNSPRAGASRIPSRGRPALTKATEIDQPGRPRMKSLVPSIGSTSQIRSAPSRSGASMVSSDSHPADGSSWPSSALRNWSTSRSATLTGSPGCLSQLSSACPWPGQRASASCPAARTIASRRARSIKTAPGGAFAALLGIVRNWRS